MEKAVLFHSQMGDCAHWEPALWLTSATTGIIICKLIYEVMGLLSPHLFTTYYNNLSENDRIEWNNRAISTGHAIWSTAASCYMFLFSDLFSDNAPYGPVFFRSTIFSQFMLGVSIGYFLMDLSMILWSYPSLGGIEYVVHHSISIFALALAVHSGYGHNYLYMVIASECTTPFVNLRWYLAKAELKNSKVYSVNGVALFLSWFLARIVLYAYIFVHIYFHYEQVKQIHTVGFYFVFISPISISVMNLYWFTKIFKGLIRTLKAKQS